MYIIDTPVVSEEDLSCAVMGTDVNHDARKGHLHTLCLTRELNYVLFTANQEVKPQGLALGVDVVTHLIMFYALHGGGKHRQEESLC